MHQARNERFYVRGCHRQNETGEKCRRGAKIDNKPLHATLKYMLTTYVLRNEKVKSALFYELFYIATAVLNNEIFIFLLLKKKIVNIYFKKC